MALDHRKVESFIYREARLLDDWKYDEWLQMWTDDALYWIPANEYDYDPNKHVSIIYADRARLEDIIGRLATGAAWAQDPPSRMRRLIGNVEVEEGDEHVTVYSNFNITELRRHKQSTFAGRATHRLLPENGSFKIAYKKVDLVNNDEVIENLTFLV